MVIKRYSVKPRVTYQDILNEGNVWNDDKLYWNLVQNGYFDNVDGIIKKDINFMLSEYK